MPEPPIALPEPPAFPTTETGREFLEYHDGARERDAIAEGLLIPEPPSFPERLGLALQYANRARARAETEMSERLLNTIRARHRDTAAAWEVAVLEHFEHPSFMMFDNLWRREFGFTCGCTGAVQQRPVSMAALNFLSPAIRALIHDMPRVALEPPRWLLNQIERNYPFEAYKPFRKKEKRALMTSRALLHQMLTREQRWSLRASGSFRVQGQDDRTYEIGEYDVALIVDGRPRVSYCIHPKVRLPVYDVMLAQKLLIEADTPTFLATANARDVVEPPRRAV